jgi:phage terminase small subunit
MEPDDHGPKMQVLSERERRFVYSYLNGGGRDAADAARQAGYSDPGHGATIRVTAHRLLHSQKVLDALEEEGRKHFHGLLVPAVAAAGALIANPKHAQHAHAVFTTLARLGLGERTEHKVTVEHVADDRVLALAQRFAAELGVDEMKLVGGNVIDGDVGAGNVRGVVEADGRSGEAGGGAGAEDEVLERREDGGIPRRPKCPSP